MAASAHSSASTLGFLILLFIQGSFQVRDCGYYEEGAAQIFTCYTKVQSTFTDFGPRMEINGVLEETGSCDSNGDCSVVDPSRYQVHFFRDSDTGIVRKNVSVAVSSVDRTFTRLHCYRNGLPVVGVECLIKVYVKASELDCEGPEFVDGNTTALYTCTSQRVYPSGRCLHFQVGGTANMTKGNFLNVITSESNSTRYPGDKEITCQLRVLLSGIPESVYSFRMVVIPDLPGLPITAMTLGNIMSPLRLGSTALVRSSDNNPELDYPMASDELRVTIHVTGNPPPNRFSLRVRYDEGVVPIPLSAHDYSVTYSAAASASPNDEEGELTLLVTGGLDQGRNSHFFFEASNGVGESSALVYGFSVKRVFAKPSQPVCSGPQFVDGNTAFVITCTSQVYPTGKCTFTQTEGEIAMKKNVEQTTSHASMESVELMTVTCDLRVSVVGSVGGDYRFRVEVTPDVPDIPPSATTVGDHLPVVTLKPMALYDPDENGHVFDKPTSGELTLDLLVTGNPAPNRVSLRVQQDILSNSLPLSSQDYRWEYDRTAGMEGGVIKLFITGGLGNPGSSIYTLNVENGVVGDFEYTFSVAGGNEAQEQKGDNSTDTALIVGIALGSALVIAIVITVVVIVVIRRGRGQPQQAHSNPGFDPPSQSVGYIYPNAAFYDPLRGETSTDHYAIPSYEESIKARESTTSGVYSLPVD